MRVLFLSLLFISIAFSQEFSDAKVKRLVKKGEKIATYLCSNEERLALEAQALPIESRIKILQDRKSCGELDKRDYTALAYFLALPKKEFNLKKISVPNNAKCPVCGMFVYKYPKWSALIVLNGEKLYFDGIKDMMKYYIFSADFPFDRKKIEAITVSDYYTLEAISAKKAFYVIGSDILGPMGNELIAFKEKKRAKNFMNDHNGKSILTFKEIDTEILRKIQ